MKRVLVLMLMLAVAMAFGFTSCSEKAKNDVGLPGGAGTGGGGEPGGDNGGGGGGTGGFEDVENSYDYASVSDEGQFIKTAIYLNPYHYELRLEMRCISIGYPDDIWDITNYTVRGVDRESSFREQYQFRGFIINRHTQRKFEHDGYYGTFNLSYSNDISNSPLLNFSKTSPVSLKLETVWDSMIRTIYYPVTFTYSYKGLTGTFRAAFIRVYGYA